MSKLRVRSFVTFALTAVAVALVVPSTEACSGSVQQDVKTALDAAQTACVFANADIAPAAGQGLGGAIAIACGIEQALAPVIEQVVASFKVQREAYAKKVAGACQQK
jgi:galactokinase/mevalonate kinase-like predicted kinase